MLLISGLTASPLQKTSFVLESGLSFSFTLYFMPMQYGWFITSLTYQNFTLAGLRVTNSPNMLYPWKNSLPFGLACFSNADREPSLQQDFSSGASNLYVLDSVDCASYTTYIQTGVLPA